MLYNSQLSKKTLNVKRDDYLEKMSWVSWRTLASFEMPCCICGRHSEIEMYHIKHVRKTKYSEIERAQNWARVMSIKNRKQIPVCKTCHNIIHSGKYKGPRLIDLRVPRTLYDNRIVCLEPLISNSETPP